MGEAATWADDGLIDNAMKDAIMATNAINASQRHCRINKIRERSKPGFVWYVVWFV